MKHVSSLAIVHHNAETPS